MLPCPSPSLGVYSDSRPLKSVMLPNHLIFCCPLLLLPSVFPSIRVFSSESALYIRWPKYRSFSFSISSCLSQLHSSYFKDLCCWRGLSFSNWEILSQVTSLKIQLNVYSSRKGYFTVSQNIFQAFIRALTSYLHSYRPENPQPDAEGRGHDCIIFISQVPRLANAHAFSPLLGSVKQKIIHSFAHPLLLGR